MLINVGKLVSQEVGFYMSCSKFDSGLIGFRIVATEVLGPSYDVCKCNIPMLG